MSINSLRVRLQMLVWITILLPLLLIEFGCRQIDNCRTPEELP